MRDDAAPAEGAHAPQTLHAHCARRVGAHEHDVFPADRADLAVEPAQLRVCDPRRSSDELDDSEDSGDARRRFRVAHVRFHSDNRKSRLLARRDRRYRAHLDRIAESGARPVRLDDAGTLCSARGIARGASEQELL